MIDDEINNRKAKREYLQRWQLMLNKAISLLPFIQRDLEITNWEIDVFENCPEEAADISRGDIHLVFVDEMNTLPSALPQMPNYESDSLSYYESVTSSGSSAVFDYVSRVADIPTLNSQHFSQTYKTKFEELHRKLNRQNDIRNLLGKLNNGNSSVRFTRAENSYIQYKSGVGLKTSAAMEMRTFLEGLKGDLWAIARQFPKENMIWELMAQRLAKSKRENNLLVRQKDKQSNLIYRLSEVGKDREGGSLTDLSVIWIELLDHVFIILKSIKI